MVIGDRDAEHHAEDERDGEQARHLRDRRRA